MGFNHNVGPQGPVGQMPPPGNMGGPSPSWKEFGAQMSAQRFNRRSKGQRRLVTILAIIVLVLVVLSGIRISMLSGNTGDQLTIHIASQQDAVVDLRQSVPINPDLFGANVLPKIASDSTDAANSGVMPYSPKLAQGLQTMGVKMLRYPGGSWGEQHILSNDQLNDFNQMLTDTKATGMLQVHLGGKSAGDPAALAAQWVQSMKSVQLWSIGSEPDLTVNPNTGKPYTADEYAEQFVQISAKMHQANPSIKVFGPELSSYFDVNSSPTAANSHAWIDEFLQKVGDYEKQHSGTTVLDGVSFHYYPQTTPNYYQPALLLSSSNEWSYILPGLRSQIKKTLGRDVPIAITEMNTNPVGTNQAKVAPAYGAIWLADTLGTLMNEQVQYAAFNSASPSVQNPSSLFALDGSETAMGRVYELFTHLQDLVIPLSVQDDPMAVFATTDKDRQTLSLLFVNKTPLPQHAQVNPSTLLYSTGSWPSQDVKVAPYSVVVLTLHRGSDQAQAYNFIPPTKDDGLVAPLGSVKCGARIDPVESTIPC